MTLPFRERDLPAPSALLVIIHPSRKRRLSLADGEAAGVLARCRATLAHARENKLPTAFVTAWSRYAGKRSRWMKGLAPSGRDMVFERSNPSCYASRYFAEAADTYRTLVIAGFPDAEGCAATVIDVLRAGHKAIFLRDAIAAPRPEYLELAALNSGISDQIAVFDTATWMEANRVGGACIATQDSGPGMTDCALTSLRRRVL